MTLTNKLIIWSLAPASLADLEKKQEARVVDCEMGGWGARVEGRAALALQTIITLTHADAPHRTTHGHSSL